MMTKNSTLLAAAYSLVIAAVIFLFSGCEAAQFRVETDLEPGGAGVTSGAGTYDKGEAATVAVEPQPGYEFIAWFEDGEKVSEREEYTFTIEGNRVLTAKFEIKGEEVEEEAEETAGEIIFKSKRSGRRLVASPDGKYLLTKENDIELGEYPLYPIYNLDAYIEETDTGKALNGRLPEDFDSVAFLPTPGADRHPHIHHPVFTPDGDKLLYVGHEYMDKAAIYFTYVGLPPKVFHRLEIDSGYTIKPAWKANQEGIYYITGEGFFSYLLEEGEEPSMLHSSSELEGFPGTTNFTFNISNNTAELAWFNDGRLLILDLESEQNNPEVIETGIDSEAVKVSYIFNGKYLALALVEDSLTLINRESGELAEIDYKYEMTDYLNTYAWNDQGELAVLQEIRESAFDLQLALYNENLEQIASWEVPRNSSEVVWLGDSWGVLESNQNSFKIHAITF